MMDLLGGPVREIANASVMTYLRKGKNCVRRVRAAGGHSGTTSGRVARTMQMGPVPGAPLWPGLSWHCAYLAAFNQPCWWQKGRGGAPPFEDPASREAVDGAGACLRGAGRGPRGQPRGA